MVEVMKTKTIEVRTFIANDGTEFSSEDECREHEERVRKRQKAENAETYLDARKLDFCLVPIQFLGSYDGYESEVTWYKVMDQEELEKLLEAFGDIYRQTVEPITIDGPTEVCLISYADYYDEGDIVTREEAIEMAEKYVKAFKTMSLE